MDELVVRPLTGADRGWLAEKIAGHWGSTALVSRGRVHDALALPGFVAWVGDSPAGVALYHRQGAACELVLIDVWVQRRGAGAALIGRVQEAARSEQCKRLWLITTNDNVPALGFYQKQGFRLAALHVNALDVSRRLKPEIPLIGRDGIPLRDEIELEMML